MTLAQDDPPLFETDEFDSRVYSRLLIQCRRGYPLWRPELPEGPDGINIGDVGVLTRDGAFSAFLNIGKSAEADRLNEARGVPDTIGHIDIKLRWEQPCAITSDGSDFPGAVFIPIDSTTTSSESKQFVRTQVPEPPGTRCHVAFTGSPEKTAALSIFPDTETSVQECDNVLALRDYACAEHRRWIEFVHRFDPQYSGVKSLFLVTGFTKSKSWARALMKKEKSLKKCSVTFTKWDEGELVEINTSPHPPSKGHFTRRRSSGNSADLNHWYTLFVRGFLITPRRVLGLFPKKPEIMDAIKDRPNVGKDLEKGGTFLHKCKKDGRGRTSTGQVRRQGRTRNSTSDSIQTFSFLAAANELILRTSPEVKVAITHDTVLDFLFLDPVICAFLENCTEEEFIGLVSANYSISKEHGCGFLERDISAGSVAPVMSAPILSQAPHFWAEQDWTNQYQQENLTCPSFPAIFTPEKYAIVYTRGERSRICM